MQVRLLLSSALIVIPAAIAVTEPHSQDAPGSAVHEQAARKRKRLNDNAADFWIYDDLEQGEAKAKTSGKPLLVSFRCVP